MAGSTLLDRMYREMRVSGRPWPEAELGEVYLKLHPGGPGPGPLLRRMLGQDARFSESPAGVWTAQARFRPTLAHGRYILTWVETREERTPEAWRLHWRPHGSQRPPAAPFTPDAETDLQVRAGPAPPHSPLSTTDPESWEAFRRHFAGWRLAAWQPGLLGRFLQWVERRWAFPEWDPPLLDLLSFSRIALVRSGVVASESLAQARLPALARRWNLGPGAEGAGEAPWSVLESVLDFLLEAHGSWTEEALAAAWSEAFTGRPIPWDRFAFTPADLETLPEGSGVYRFRDADGGLLYVGKSACLARRIRSYFSALPPEPSKREELLWRIHSFAVEPLPSELEAQLRESWAIRAERPPWNVQVEVHATDVPPPDLWWPLVFVAPGADPLRATAVLLPGPDSGYLFHLPRQAQEGGLERLAAWLEECLEAGNPLSPGNAGELSGLETGSHSGTETGTAAGPAAAAILGLTPLERPEARLALRYYLRWRDALHRVDTVHFTSGLALTEALLSLARAASGGPDLFDQRPPER